MSWTVQDQGEALHDNQSIMFQEYLDVLIAGVIGVDFVLSGCAVTTAGTNLTLDVSKGAVISDSLMFPVTAGTVTIGAADATNPRFDLVVANSAGTKAVRAGTAAATPKPPDRSANDVVLAVVYVPANDTVITSNQITDMRILKRGVGPICIYKTTTAEVTNNTAAAIEALNKTNSGVTIPNGLFLAGKILRVRMWGNILQNSGVVALQIAIRYGGTTMFNDTSAATVADPDRRPWMLDFNIVAQGNSDQAMGGVFWMVDPQIASTAPTTGIGDAWGIASTAEGNTAIGGSAAVDSDAADRLLSVIITLGTASATLVELVVEGATVELL